MSYVAWSVVSGEQPSAAKWNLIGSDMASFHDGTGIASLDGVLTGTYSLTGTVTIPTIYSGGFAQTIPSTSADTLVARNTVDTLQNKRRVLRIATVVDAATITPNIDSYDQLNVTALAQAATIAAPTGSPNDGDLFLFRFKDNGSSRVLTWNSTYRVVGQTLPTTTVAGKIIYVGTKYNAADTKYDVIAVSTEA